MRLPTRLLTQITEALRRPVRSKPFPTTPWNEIQDQDWAYLYQIEDLLEAMDDRIYGLPLRELSDITGYRINLTDHQGRRFLQDFYVDNAPAVGRFGVWGFSASGAPQLVAWPRGRGPNGNRVRTGWGNQKNAQKVADQLNEAAAAWCVLNGPLPKSKPKAKKKRK
jgi:hypothetical protein